MASAGGDAATTNTPDPAFASLGAQPIVSANGATHLGPVVHPGNSRDSLARRFQLEMYAAASTGSSAISNTFSAFFLSAATLRLKLPVMTCLLSITRTLL